MSATKMRKKKIAKVVYSSEQEAAIVLAQYKQLLLHPGWMRIVKFYKTKIELYKEELLSKDIKSLDELERIRNKIDLCTQMINLPEILIADIETNKDIENQVQNLDPFA